MLYMLEALIQGELLLSIGFILKTFYAARLVARKWAEIRKWGGIITHFPIYPNTGKGK